MRQVAAEPRERADFIVEWKIQLSGCRSRRTIAALMGAALRCPLSVSWPVAPEWRWDARCSTRRTRP